jgi:hypothetical protein
MRWILVVLIGIHGLIHFMGFARAFGYAELPQLTQPISKGMGVLWLAAGLGLLTSGALLVSAPRFWWAIGFASVVASQIVIASSWGDAKLGTIANVVVLLGVVYGFAAYGPLSFRATYAREVSQRLAQQGVPALVTEADLAALPEPVQRYVRLSGAVGRPRVHHFRAVWRGRIRAGPADPWMPFTAEQHNFPGEPARFFLMDARKGGLPVDVLHAFSGDSAVMRVRLLSLLPLANAGGPEARRAETVTLLNDLSILAPAALIDPAIRWEPIDARSARAFYAAGRDTISAVLHFNEAGELVDFVSDDRLVASPDGTDFNPQRWSTPLRDYRTVGGWHVGTRGEGRWHPPEGAFTYLEIELLQLETNGGG